MHKVNEEVKKLENPKLLKKHAGNTSMTKRGKVILNLDQRKGKGGSGTLENCR